MKNIKPLDQVLREAAIAAGQAMQIPKIGRLDAHWEKKSVQALDAILRYLDYEGYEIRVKRNNQDESDEND